MSQTSPNDVNLSAVLSRFPDRPVLCTACGAAQGTARRLMTRDEVNHYLALSFEQVQFLINTRQITKIRIKGEIRFDSLDLDPFIDGYKKTAQRSAK